MASQIVSNFGRTQDSHREARPDRALREANRHMHDFLDLLGHELRSPLAAIQNALCVLKLEGSDAETREWAHDLMERQTQCIARLVDDLMDISRIEHGKIHLRKRTVDLRQVMVRATETVRAAIEERGHRLELILPLEPIAMNADPDRLEQVLTNLLNNSAKYMEPGGRIWLTAQAQGDDFLLQIQDTGIGIDPAMIPHIFDPFWQIERTLDHSEGGLGIGLALVRKLVELHGGTVTAHSAGLGCGSKFVVCLPVHANELGNGD